MKKKGDKELEAMRLPRSISPRLFDSSYFGMHLEVLQQGRLCKKSENIIAFMVRYLLAPRLRQAGLTTNGRSNTYGLHNSFALRYRRGNETFCEVINT
jgi:hypothetical protein